MEVKELNEAITSMKTAFEEFKDANDAAMAGQTEKHESVDKIVKELEESVKTVQAKVARQNSVAQASEDGQKILGDFNKIRAKMGRGEMSHVEAKDYTEVLEKFIRARGKAHSLSDVELKTLQEGVDSDGGYFVMPELSNAMLEKDFETSPMENFATIENTTSDRFGYYVDFDEFDAAYTSELKERQTTDTAKLGKKFIDVHSVFLKVPVSNELLEDSGTDITSWVMRKANEKEVRIRNNNYINGNGDGRERGLLAAPAVVGSEGKFGEVERIITGAATPSYDDLINLFAELHDRYANNASMLMSRQFFFKELLKLKGTDGHYIVDIFSREGVPTTLAGVNIGFMQDMAKDASVANQDLIVYGDIKQAYSIVKRRGMSLLADPFSLDGGVLFKMDSRGGGDYTNTQAVKILRRTA